jgi:hypothetical protein
MSSSGLIPRQPATMLLDEKRPSIISKRTQVRKQKQAEEYCSGIPTPRVLDRMLVGLGSAGVASLNIYSHYRKLSLWELAGITLGTLTLGYGLFDLGKRNGMMKGAGFALHGNQEMEDGGHDWREEFKGVNFDELTVAEKIAWLRKEEEMIKNVQAEEELRCGQAYIKKEEAYVAYEKYGGYGGPDWKA